ncbi:MAG: thymidine phosphorylase [Anaerolineales bacterium]
MRAVDIIIKKRDGGILSTEEIHFFIEGYASGDIPDYQASAWAMAVLQKGMTSKETADLTTAIAASGDTIDLSGIAKIAVDKHSTGGVGDKTTLVVQPIVAACGVPVGKMSGRGLGFTGGTLDKMESIEGFRVDLSTDEFMNQLEEIGLVLSGQTADLAPADGKLYALRDVTGTVPSIPLIASSVMSKKIAGGAQGIVLDVKVGNGAFMQSVEDGLELARLMVDIGVHAGSKVVALLSDMNQPLGNAVGNALEVREAVETLQNGGPGDFREHCIIVASHMLLLAEKIKNLSEARGKIEDELKDGRAYDKMVAMVSAQGGDTGMLENLDRLPKAPIIKTHNAQKAGFVALVHAREVGLSAMELGAGRAKKSDPVDHAVGVVVHTKVGDTIAQGEPLFTVHAQSEEMASAAAERLCAAHDISDEPVEPLPLFYETVE